MYASRTLLLCLIAALTLASGEGAFAQKMTGRGPSSDTGGMRPTGPSGGGYHGDGPRGPGWAARPSQVLLP